MSSSVDAVRESPASLRAVIARSTFETGIWRPGRKRGAWDHTAYESLLADARSLGRALADAGARGKPVAIVARANIDLGTGFLGAMSAGALPVLLRARRPFEGRPAYVAEVASLAASVDAAALVVDSGSAGVSADIADAAGIPAVVALDEARELADPGDADLTPEGAAAFLQFTSGSSGRPKPVAVTWPKLDAAVRSLSEWIDVRPGDAAGSWLPLYHDMGLIGFFVMPIVHDAPLWLLSPDEFLRYPVRWIDSFSRGATIAACPTFGLRYCADRLGPADVDGLDVSGWRVMAVGAERVVPSVLQRFHDLLAPHGFHERTFLPAYGLAEATLGVTGRVPGAPSRVVRARSLDGPGAAVDLDRTTDLLGADGEGAWLVSCGPPMPGCGVRVVDGDGDGRDAAEGVLGEIAVTSHAIAAPWPDGEEPAELKTGDVGFFLDGELYVVGRAGDSISVNGRVLYAEHLEVALAAVLPALRFAVALGSTGGHETVAVVVEARETAGGVAADVERFLRARVGVDVAVRVHVWRPGSMPLTSSGKPRRNEIWRMLERAAHDARSGGESENEQGDG